jgi:hypothetical protein
MSRLRLDGALSLLSVYAFWLAQEQLYLKKSMPIIIFCIFFLSSPHDCTVVSVERGAGLW